MSPEDMKRRGNLSFNIICPAQNPSEHSADSREMQCSALLRESESHLLLANDDHWDYEETWHIRFQIVQSLLRLGLATEWMERFYVLAIDATASFTARGLEDLGNLTLRLG